MQQTSRQDKISFDYVEAQVTVICMVCNKHFQAFPDLNEFLFACPRCGRNFKFVFSVKPLNQEELNKEQLKQRRFL